MESLPFYYPTRIILIDDEPHVLRMNELLFRQLPFVSEVLSFERADLALNTLEQSIPASTLDRSFSDLFYTAQVNDDINEDSPETIVQRNLSICLSNIPHILSSPQRHHMLSVIVCDYSMPSMNGLEFFSHYQPNHVRRLLLTAVCDEHNAILAFNQGLIHQFIHKAHQSGPQALEQALQTQTIQYFQSLTQTLYATLDITPEQNILSHPQLNILLTHLCSQHDIREFAFLPRPTGFELHIGSHLTPQKKRLLLADSYHYDRALQVTQEIDGPLELQEALRHRTILPTGIDGFPIYEAEDKWQQLSIASLRIGNSPNDKQALYWALIDA